ncbi:MAG: GNAT family N-acetyltransferase [Mycoplasmatales bacterium]
MLKVQYSLQELKKTKYYFQMLELEKKLFGNTLEAIYKFDNSLKFNFLISEFDNLFGFMIYKDHGIAYDIFKIGIECNCQKKGFGNLLISDLFDKDIVLEVRVTNEAAVKFYESNGFYKFEILKGYYKGVDGVKMLRRI